MSMGSSPSTGQAQAQAQAQAQGSSMRSSWYALLMVCAPHGMQMYMLLSKKQSLCIGQQGDMCSYPYCWKLDMWNEASAELSSRCPSR